MKMDILRVTAGNSYQNVVVINTIQAEAAEMFPQTCRNAVDMCVIESLKWNLVLWFLWAPLQDCPHEVAPVRQT